VAVPAQFVLHRLAKSTLNLHLHSRLSWEWDSKKVADGSFFCHWSHSYSCTIVKCVFISAFPATSVSNPFAESAVFSSSPSSFLLPYDKNGRTPWKAETVYIQRMHSYLDGMPNSVSPVSVSVVLLCGLMIYCLKPVQHYTYTIGMYTANYSTESQTKQAVGRRPPQYAPPLLLPLWAPKRLAPPSRPRLHTAT